MSTQPPPTGSPTPRVTALNCPNCGGAITLRALGQASSVVCEGCGSILDAKDPKLQVIQTFQRITSSDPPLIPLGTRGKIRGTDYEVIGFERRTIRADMIDYHWHEYVLFNPYKGFRYLTEYQGHWNDISVCKVLPSMNPGFSISPKVDYLGESYRHFQTVDASTDFVLGEFPWQVRKGERANISDYVHPPQVLSCERMAGEVTWSIGEYLTGRDVWSAFHLSGSPPPAIGVYENEPSPFSANLKSVWAGFAALAFGLLVMLIAFDTFAINNSVFRETYRLYSGATAEASFVTPTFELTGRSSNVQVITSTDLQNNWIYVNYALINQDTGQAWDFGREVSFYSGRDSDGAWSEGNRIASVVVPSVPAGQYYLRVEPEADTVRPPVTYIVEVKRDVPVTSFFGIGFLALLIPAILLTWRSVSFEKSRWAESDHPILVSENN